MANIITKSSANGWDIPKRRLRLTLSGTNIFNALTEDVNVKFNTVEAVSGGLTEANITITGIAVRKMFALSTSTTQWVENWTQNTISIVAGYYNNSAQIFTGNIIEGKPNLDTADYSVTLKAVNPFEQMTRYKGYCFPGTVPVSTIVAQMAADADMGFVDALQDNSYVLNNFATREASIVDNIRMISSAIPVDIYISNNRLYLKKIGERGSGMATFYVNARNMIGAPTPTPTGCRVRIKMTAGVRSGQPVSVTSKKYPQLNSIKFFLSRIAHVGDTRGADWYTELELVKEGLGWFNNE
ncbi:MAG: hypothetical protein IKD78_06295 [Bacteroidales bacterium]|nr:hypothetical protein [Bacteroidales bacterium]